MEPMKILGIIVERYKNILGKNLVGVYLHGSLAMGCYTIASDIDFIVLVKESIDIETKKRIIESIIHLENLPEKGIEMSIVLEKYAKEFIYPTPFELHYSDFHKDRYISDSGYICGGFTDKDLAAHFTIIKHRGICIYGKSIGEAFSDVPRKYYIDSIVHDIEEAKTGITEDTVYITLNLCRVLYYIKENMICSKLEAGNWAKEIVPLRYIKIIEDAVNVYSNKLGQMEYNKDILVKYADYMLKEIDTYNKLFNKEVLMERFMIGQFDKFDINRQNRDFRDNFFGIEVNQMDSIEELEILKCNIRERKLNIGIHFPLLKSQWRARDPQFLSKDNTIYEESIHYMESEFARAKEFNPVYILLHYPKPVILDDNVDWSCWRFNDDTEYYYESQMSYKYFEERTRNFFKIYSEQGTKYNFIPVLELDGLNRYVYKTNLIEELLDTYSNIKLCLDFGRIHLQDCIDDNFIGKEIIRKFGKYAYLVHLWNVKVDANVTNSHYPALKSLKKKDGWGDMKSYFKILNEVKNDYKVLFEHKSHLISDVELEECYQWVNEITNQ